MWGFGVAGLCRLPCTVWRGARHATQPIDTIYPSLFRHGGAFAHSLPPQQARVLQEVNSLLATEQGQDQAGGGRGGRGGAATATAAPPAAESSSAFGSELSRAIFGGSAQVSELEAERTRQALQRTLEGSAASGSPPIPISRPPPGEGAGAGGGGGGAAPAAAEAAAKQRPAWAQELFASGTPASAAAAAPAAPATSTSSTSPRQPSAAGPSGASAGAARNGGGGGGGGGMRFAPSSTTGKPALPSAAPSPSASYGGGGGPAALAAEPPPPQMQRASRLAEWTPLAFADADLSLPTELTLKSEVRGIGRVCVYRCGRVCMWGMGVGVGACGCGRGYEQGGEPRVGGEGVSCGGHACLNSGPAEPQGAYCHAYTARPRNSTSLIATMNLYLPPQPPSLPPPSHTGLAPDRPRPLLSAAAAAVGGGPHRRRAAAQQGAGPRRRRRGGGGGGQRRGVGRRGGAGGGGGGPGGAGAAAGGWGRAPGGRHTVRAWGWCGG